MCLSIRIVICIEQHLSNVLSSIHEKLSNTEAELKKSLLIKKTCISRSKGNQSMKSGQLIEYNMENILTEKSYTKCVGETSSRTLSKRSKLSISLDQ